MPSTQRPPILASAALTWMLALAGAAQGAAIGLIAAIAIPGALLGPILLALIPTAFVATFIATHACTPPQPQDPCLMQFTAPTHYIHTTVQI